jgi:hypothetical protein
MLIGYNKNNSMNLLMCTNCWVASIKKCENLLFLHYIFNFSSTYFNTMWKIKVVEREQEFAR